MPSRYHALQRRLRVLACLCLAEMLASALFLGAVATMQRTHWRALGGAGIAIGTAAFIALTTTDGLVSGQTAIFGSRLGRAVRREQQPVSFWINTVIAYLVAVLALGSAVWLVARS